MTGITSNFSETIHERRVQNTALKVSREKNPLRPQCPAKLSSKSEVEIKTSLDKN